MRFYRSSTVGSYQQAYFGFGIERHEVTCHALQVRPFESSIMPWDLIASGGNHVPSIRSWKNNFCRFIDATDRETRYLFTCDCFLSEYG